jgi:hypothetical protein
MPWLFDYLTGLHILSKDWGKYILLGVFVVGFMVLLVDLWGRSTAKSEDYPHKHWIINYWNQRTEDLSEKEIKLQKRLRDAGVDWILGHCLIHSPNASLIFRKPKFFQIKRVVAAWAGYVKDVRGPDNYRWVVELQNGRFMYLYGFFDPSGFELRTYLFSRVAGSAEEAARFEINPMTLRSIKRNSKDQEVYEALLDQIQSDERDWAGFKWGTDYTA